MRKNKFIQTPGRGPMAKYKEVAKLLGPQANGNDDKIDPTTGVKNTSSITVPKPLTSQERSRIGLWKADTESKSFTINEAASRWGRGSKDFEQWKLQRQYENMPKEAQEKIDALEKGKKGEYNWEFEGPQGITGNYKKTKPDPFDDKELMNRYDYYSKKQ
jgi:hypothetical protein|tara:strand:+ start:128 stop:607 length:480 start_codon:yes stop_codon:yes gene_type:complete